jgi:hypothetical protein
MRWALLLALVVAVGCTEITIYYPICVDEQGDTIPPDTTCVRKVMEATDG